MTAHAWLAANLPAARPFPKHDSATMAWRTPALFIKFFPYALQERAAVEAELASASLHENIIPSLLMSGVDDGVILIYPFVSGEPLGTPEARAKFYALPESERRAALKTILAALATITSAGWTLVDFYEGNLIYDYENKKPWLFDWDLCVKAEGFTLATERNWGSSRLMAPEEFIQGARIDSQTNVFNLARLATLTLGSDATQQENAVLARATSPEKSARHGSVAAFVAALGL
jgi:serine/threonine protein kinase, bacterial